MKVIKNNEILRINSPLIVLYGKNSSQQEILKYNLIANSFNNTIIYENWREVRKLLPLNPEIVIINLKEIKSPESKIEEISTIAKDAEIILIGDIEIYSEIKTIDSRMIINNDYNTPRNVVRRVNYIIRRGRLFNFRKRLSRLRSIFFILIVVVLFYYMWFSSILL